MRCMAQPFPAPVSPSAKVHEASFWGAAEGMESGPHHVWGLHRLSTAGTSVRSRAEAGEAGRSCWNTWEMLGTEDAAEGTRRGPSERGTPPGMFSGPCPSEVCRCLTRVCDGLWVGTTPCVRHLPVDTGCSPPAAVTCTAVSECAGPCAPVFSSRVCAQEWTCWVVVTAFNHLRSRRTMSTEAATFHPTGFSGFYSPLVLTYTRILLLFLKI